MNISASSTYPIIPLLRYRYIIFIIRHRLTGKKKKKRGRPCRSFTPLFPVEEKKKTDTCAKRWGDPYTRAFSVGTIDFGIRWQFFKPMANNYRILPPSSGFRHKRPKTLLTTHATIKRPTTHGFCSMKRQEKNLTG